METDIGNPIEYDPGMDPLNNQNNNEEVVQEDQRQYYNDYNMQVPHEFSPTPPSPPEKVDFFSTIEKSTWIIAFAVFLLGFFMGKTMQPVILRYT
jgi:hypothetical protein